MSTALNVNDLLKCRIWCSNAEQASVNTLWYQVLTIGSPPATDLDVATEMDTGFLNTALPPMLNNLTMYNGVQVQIYRPIGGTNFIYAAEDSVAGAGMGTGGAIALPRQTSGLTHWGTVFAGRQYRGRSYWPFPSVSHDVGDGTPTAAYVTLVDTLGTGFLALSSISGVGTATVQLVMMHRKPKVGDTPLPTIIRVATAENKWATQRRRGSYGRPNVSPI